MAFRVTNRVMGALKERNDVQPALRKVWKSYEHQDGVVTRHLSPFQQNILGSLVAGAPKKILNRWNDHGLHIVMSISIFLGVSTWADWKYQQVAYEHRD